MYFIRLALFIDKLYSVVGGVYVFCHVYCQESNIWLDLNLNEDWNLVQVGMLLLFLQVRRRRTKKQQP